MVEWKISFVTCQKAITQPQCFNFSSKNSHFKARILANSHTKTWLHYQFPGGSSRDTKWPQLWRLRHVAAIWSPSSTKVPSSGHAGATDGSHIGGLLFYCIGEIIGLRSFYSYFSGRAKEERQQGLKRKRSIWYFISRLGQPFKKNHSDVVLREIHCAELELAASPQWRRHSSVL